MAITAAGSNADRIVRSDTGQSLFDDGKSACDASSSWNQGDLIAFNTTAHALRRVAATGDAVTIVGIADNVVTNGNLVGPYDGLTQTNSTQSSPGFVGPKFGCVASMKLKTGDTFHIGDKVYLVDGGDSQTVTVTDPGDANYIGIFVGPAAVSSAAAGQQGQIKLGARYPSDTGTGLNF